MVFTSQVKIYCVSPTPLFLLSLFKGGLFFAKPMRDQNYITMMDPFQRKYGKTLTGLLAVVPFISEVMWVPVTLISLGNTNTVTFSFASYVHYRKYMCCFQYLHQGSLLASSLICRWVFASGSLLQWPSSTPFLEVSTQSFSLTSSSCRWCFAAWWVWQLFQHNYCLFLKI